MAHRHPPSASKPQEDKRQQEDTVLSYYRFHTPTDILPTTAHYGIRCRAIGARRHPNYGGGLRRPQRSEEGECSGQGKGQVQPNGNHLSGRRAFRGVLLRVKRRQGESILSLTRAWSPPRQPGSCGWLVVVYPQQPHFPNGANDITCTRGREIEDICG